MGMTTNTGGPAFPTGNAYQGMTLRDYFAAKAMQAMITNDVIHSVTMTEAHKAGIPEELALAQISFMVADAMLKAREQK
jgi:hypothetical protein